MTAKQPIDLVDIIADYYNNVEPEVKETAIRRLKENVDIKFRAASEEALLN